MEKTVIPIESFDQINNDSLSILENLIEQERIIFKLKSEMATLGNINRLAEITELIDQHRERVRNSQDMKDFLTLRKKTIAFCKQNNIEIISDIKGLDKQTQNIRIVIREIITYRKTEDYGAVNKLAMIYESLKNFLERKK